MFNPTDFPALSVVAGHWRRSCDVVAMAKGGVGMWYGCSGWPRDLWELSVPAGMETVREEGVALFDHLCGHKHISSPLLTGSADSGGEAS